MKVVLLLLVFAHLTLVALGASYVKIAPWIPGKNIIEFYQKASGSDSSYGFFAPNIGLKSRAVFDIIDKKGNMLSDIVLAAGSGREVEIRLGGIYDEFSSKQADDAIFRKPLAASLAAAIFSQYSEATQVTLRVQQYLQISILEYQQGKREQWSDYYSARFARTLKSQP